MSSPVGQAAIAAIVVLCLWAGPAAAVDLFARHRVAVEFADPDGKPLADAEVRVFAPGQPGRPALTGRTDSAGRFEFSANDDGMWSAEARTGDEIARVSIRVGGSQQQQPQEPPSPVWLVGGLLLLLVLAFGYRRLRARNRRHDKAKIG